VTKVESVLDTVGAPHDAVDVDIIDILGSDSDGFVVGALLHVDGRFDLIVE
jgi:hypothetical protein